MRRFAFALLILALATAVPADEPKPAAKVYDIPAAGLTIDGKLTKDDPPLAVAPIEEAKGSPHQIVRVNLKKGQSYVFYLNSEQFDAFLILQDAAGQALAFDDDSGGDTNSRIVQEVKADGEYRLLVVTLDKNPGAFQLKVRPGGLTEEERLADQATKLNAEGIRLYQQGKPADAVAKLRQALEIRQKLYPEAKYPGGHPDLANSLNNLGAVLEAMGRAEEAVPHSRAALEMRQRLYPEAKYPGGHPRLAGSLNNLGAVLNAMGRAEEALPHYRAALEMMRRLYPEAKYPDGHRDLATSLNNLGFVLQAMGRAEEALPHHRAALEMRQRLYPEAKFPGGHPDLATSLNNLSNVLKAMGRAEEAVPHFRAALEMNRRLYPEAKYPGGHPDLAASLNNLGSVLEAMGRAEEAVPHFRAALEMYRRLYPEAKYPGGHPDLATSLNNLGAVLLAMGRAEEAVPHYRAALEMYRRLYPEAKYPGGHPDLATSLNNLGFLLNSMGRAEEALPHSRAALEMRQRLYPEAKYPGGHPDLAISLGNLGSVLFSLGRAEEALPHYRDSLAMQQRLLRRELATASEQAALDKVQAEPPYRDAYLSVTRSTNVPPGDVLTAVWPSRSMVTRLLEQRQANARAVGTELGAKLDELRGLRRQVDRLLQDSRHKPEERDRLIAVLAAQRDSLEREVVAAIPTLQRWQELDKLGPTDLARALPKGAVFVEVLRYTHIEYVEKKQKRTPSYVAFVVSNEHDASASDAPKNPLAHASGSLIRRIELGDAATIEALVSAWRSAIDPEGAMRAAPGAADAIPPTKPVLGPDRELTRLVWAKIAPAIPAGTKSLYLALDGDLARMPWAALPIGGDQVLLEKFALAQVPHGTFLLDRLRSPRPGTGESLVALGGVDYGKSPWPELKGTSAEVRAVTAVAPGTPATLAGADATAPRLKALLPGAGYLHLATHGQFRAKDFAEERKRAEKARERAMQGEGPVGLGAKNPLGYVGVVLSGGDVLSGLAVLDLPLSQCRLVTLSACETGLGALTGGEGVQGLQRAFHLAGCPNVVASLWQVSDAATAALMAKFYHELWVNKKPPIEALREAQLFIYHHPELIDDLAGKRGAPKLKESLATPVSASPRAAGRAKTHQWAAFVLSGTGR